MANPQKSITEESREIWNRNATEWTLIWAKAAASVS